MRINKNLVIFVTLALSLVVRIYLSQFDGYKYDINEFKSWSQTVYNVGINNFYTSVWSNYPPFYIYILWIVGAVYKFFSPSFDINTNLFTVLIKLPANVADILIALLIFKILNKQFDKDLKDKVKDKYFKIAYFGMILYVFNPAIIYDSAIWGQVDSIYTLFVLLSIMLSLSDKLELAGISLALAILTKPQSLVILPLFVIIGMKNLATKNLIKFNYSLILLKFLKILIPSVLVFVLLALPFYLNNPYQLIDQLIKIYESEYGLFTNNSMDAFNLWVLSSQIPDNTIFFLSLSYRIWGYLIFGLLFVFVSIIIIKIDHEKNKKFIYLATAVILFGFFMFFTRIHERYLFPTFAFLAIIASLDKRITFLFFALTVTFFFNLYYVLQFLNNQMDMIQMSTAQIISFTNLFLFILTFYCFADMFLEIRESEKSEIKRMEKMESI